MGVNKVEFGGETLIDLTGDTVTPETLAEGETAHDASGERIVGVMSKTGSATPTVSQVGTWRVIDEPEIPQTDLPLEFSSRGTEYCAIGTTSMGSSTWGINALAYKLTGAGYYDAVYTNNPSGSYGISHGWANENHRYITVTKEPTDTKTIAWLNNNTDAPKVELSDDSPKMPQIRFTSVRGMGVDARHFSTEGSFYTGRDEAGEDGEPIENYPVYFTVEIVGGTLQVGDQLQLCKRTAFMGCQSNDERKKIKLKRVAEYVVTEDDLDKRFLTVEASATTNGKVSTAFFRDGTGGNGVCISPLYLRIRRPKGDLQNNDSGQTVDAIFSNVETIWKRYHRAMRTIKFI